MGGGGGQGTVSGMALAFQLCTFEKLSLAPSHGFLPGFIPPWDILYADFSLNHFLADRHTPCLV